MALREELILPVPLDARLRDWAMVKVRAAEGGTRLGEAEQLRVDVYDSLRRSGAAKRVARNVDLLIFGRRTRRKASEPLVHIEEV